MERTQKKKTAKPYSPEFPERAVRMAIAGRLGCSPDGLRVWMRQIQRDGGERPGQTSAEKARSEPLRRHWFEPNVERA